MIYVIKASELVRYCHRNHHDIKPVEDLSADEVKQLAGDWHYKNWDEFIKAFNDYGKTNDDIAPFPNKHFIVELKS